MENFFDAVVVGGGPAGLSAAQRLAAGGQRVVVFERGTAFGEPVRTSGGSFIGPLRRLGVPRHLWHPVSRLRLVGPADDVTFRYRRVRMCILDVRGLYQWLAAQAALAGAALQLKAHVTGPLVEDGVVVGVTVRGLGEVRARLVIDASGTPGVIAREVGLRGSAPRIGAGLEREVVAPRFDQREAFLIVGDRVAPGGYAWAFPRGEGRVRLGVGVVRPASDADLAALLDGLLDAVPALGAACAGAQPIETHAGVMSTYAHGAVPTAAPGLLVVGDAAGHGSTLLGEGIRHAMVSGRLAGEVGTTALARGGGSPELAVLQRFTKNWDKTIGRQMRVGWALHGRVSQYQDADWSQAIGAVSQMSPGLVMTALAGELTPRFAARLALRHPMLAVREGRRFVTASVRTPSDDPQPGADS